MTMWAIRVTLKQHRFEVGAAALVAVVVGAWALFIDYRLGVIYVPTGCIDDWLSRGPAGREQCVGPMHAWGSVLGTDGEQVLSWLKVLPFTVGLLAGVPIVAREFESRTAQIAWSLNGSRARWLLRQVAPILVVVGLAVTFVALAAGFIQEDRQAWGQSAFLDIGFHGPLVVTRAFGAFGLGLLAGAITGRSLPAFVVGGALSIVLASGVGVARDAWLGIQDPEVIEESSSAITTGWAWRASDGVLLDDQEAKALVPVDVAELDRGQAQAVHSIQWLEGRGYELLAVGVTEEVAAGWSLYDGVCFGLAGTAGLGATVVVVNRRRPT